MKRLGTALCLGAFIGAGCETPKGPKTSAGDCSHTVAKTDNGEICVGASGDASGFFDEVVAMRPGLGGEGSGLLGEYLYDDWGVLVEPVVVLDASDGPGGASLWQSHGCAAVPMSWGIQLEDNAPVVIAENGDAVQINIWWLAHDGCVFKCTSDVICDDALVGTYIEEPYPYWQGATVTLWSAEAAAREDFQGRISIYGERWK